MIKGEDIYMNKNNSNNNNNNNDNSITITNSQVTIVIDNSQDNHVCDMATKIKQLEERNKQLEEENKLLIEQLHEEDDTPCIWIEIPRHPMSNNYMYDFKNGGKRSNRYNEWIKDLHLDEYLPDELDGIDTTREMRIDIFYGYKSKFDVTNFQKAIQDQLAKYYGFNDGLFKVSTQNHESYVTKYADGYMKIRISNVDIDRTNFGIDDDDNKKKKSY